MDLSRYAKETKKDLFFNFGPYDSFFFRLGPQTRRYPRHDTIPKNEDAFWDQWGKLDSVAWNLTEQYSFLFACGRKSEQKHNWAFTTASDKSDFGAWVQARDRAPLRCVVGEERGNYFLWMLHGDFLAGPNCPLGMKQAAIDGHKIYTHVRVAALGVDDTWLLIWEDGSMLANLGGQYPDLEKKLDGLAGEDISWVVLNPFRAGDYFIYIDKTKTASFQVSVGFGRELEDVLTSQGIRTSDIMLRRQELARPPPSIPQMLQHTNVQHHVTDHVAVNIGALGNAIVSVIQGGVKLSALAATATCNVM